MRPRLLTAGVIVGLFAAWSATSVDAAPASTFRLTGSHTASTEFVLHAQTTFDLEHIQTTGMGTFAGFYIEAVDRPAAERTADGARLGAVTIRDWHAPGAKGLTLSFTEPSKNRLRAGRYRAYLLADGPTSVRVTTKGSGSISLRPARAASATLSARTDILTSPVAASNTQPITITGRRNVSLIGVLVGKFRAYAGSIGGCFRTLSGECGQNGDGKDGNYVGWVLSPLEDSDIVFEYIYDPGVLKPGRYEAHQEALNATTLQYASGAAFSLALD